jgi:hypothetical protein
LSECFGDDGGLFEFDAEAEVDQRMEKACRISKSRLSIVISDVGVYQQTSSQVSHQSFHRGRRDIRSQQLANLSCPFLIRKRPQSRGSVCITHELAFNVTVDPCLRSKYFSFPKYSRNFTLSDMSWTTLSCTGKCGRCPALFSSNALWISDGVAPSAKMVRMWWTMWLWKLVGVR